MIRPQEKIIARKSALYAVSIHIVLIAIMIVSFEWQVKMPQIAEVELWDSIPESNHKVINTPITEKINPEPQKTIDKPSKIEEIIKSLTSDSSDINLKQKKEEEQKKIEDKKKKDDLKKIQDELLKQDQLAKLQQELLQDKSKVLPSKVANPRSTEGVAKLGEMDKYKMLIQRKIQQNVNNQLCGIDNLEIQYEIGLLPTGQLIGNPKLLKSSGIAVCDESVERAIFQSQPLPVPTDTDLFTKFKNLKLTFHPNEKI